VEDDDLLSRRTWRWLRTRIIGLLSVEGGRVNYIFYPPKSDKKSQL